MRIILNALLVLIVVVAIHKKGFAQDNGDFLSGVFGNQVETKQGAANGSPSNNNSNDELRLGIFDDETDSGTSAAAGGGGVGAGGGGGASSGDTEGDSPT